MIRPHHESGSAQQPEQDGPWPAGEEGADVERQPCHGEHGVHAAGEMEGDVVRCEGRREQNEEQSRAACGRIPTRSLQQQARQEGEERQTADGSRQEQRKDGVTGK